MIIHDEWLGDTLILPRGGSIWKIIYRFECWRNKPDYVRDMWKHISELIKQDKEGEIFHVIREDYRKRTGQYYKYYI